MNTFTIPYGYFTLHLVYKASKNAKIEVAHTTKIKRKLSALYHNFNSSVKWNKKISTVW